MEGMMGTKWSSYGLGRMAIGFAILLVGMIFFFFFFFLSHSFSPFALGSRKGEGKEQERRREGKRERGSSGKKRSALFSWRAPATTATTSTHSTHS